MADSGQVLSHYQILHPLGKGGMGEVFLAEDTVLGRKVALKFLPEEAYKDSAARTRFLREAKSAAALDDPFICKIYETGEVDGRPFIAMEYVEGESLRSRLDRSPMPLAEAVTTAVEVAEALGVAHEHGIIHRDLKPSNIMLTPQGHAKVLDFGLAKQVSMPGKLAWEAETATSADLTGFGATLGTLAYMSPEQLRAEPLGPSSDVFSLGVVLHEMVTGRHPFDRPSGAETINAIMNDQAPPLEVAEATVPEGLIRVLEKALAKDPKDRYDSAVALADELRSASRMLLETRKDRPTTAIVVATAVAAVVIGGGVWLALRGGAPVPVVQPSRLSVLIADFDNKTGDELFTGVLERATAIVLEDASFITPFKREAALKTAHAIRPGAAVLDDELAQLVAQREGVNIVVSGAIVKESGRYVISMAALDPVSGKTVGRYELKASRREEVLTLVGRLAGQIRESLGDTSPEAVRRAAEETFTATTLEAAHAYVQAQDLLAAGKWQEAIDAFSELVKHHPEMGRAYAGIAVALANMNRLEEATKFYERAMAHIDQMTEREKGRTRGTYYLMTRNYGKASELYEQLVRAYPFDEAARVNLVLGYFYARQMDRSLMAAREAAKGFPQSPVAQANLALVALYAGDFKGAESQAAVVLQAHPAYETAYVGLGLAQLALNKPEEAASSYQRLSGISAWGTSLAAAGLADLALYQGRLADAAAILARSAKTDLKAGDGSAQARKLTALGQAELLRGRSADALRAARQAVAANQQDPVLFEAARTHLGAGDEAGAMELAARLAQRLAPEPRAYAKLIEGEIALARAEPPRAVSLFTEAQTILDTWLGRVDLGLAYLESHAYTEAHAEFEAALGRRGEAVAVFLDDLPTYHYLPPVYYYLGRAQEGLGSPAAADSYRTFLALKEKGGGDPLIADARQRLQAH